MLEDYINPGDKVELQVIQGAFAQKNGDAGRIYKSQITDIISEDKLDLTMPVEKGKLILLPVDGEYNLYIYSQNGQYQCFCKISDRYRTNNMHMITVDLLSGLQKMQRRTFYRFPCAFEMKCRELSDYELLAVASNSFYELNSKIPFKKAVIVDISGGGIRFVSEDSFEEGTVLYSSFRLPGQRSPEEYSVCIKVLRFKNLENRQDMFEYRSQYTIIDEDDREDIIRYIFEEERKIRRKRKEEEDITGNGNG